MLQNRSPNGRFPKGANPNPGGRAKRLAALDEALAREHAPADVLEVISKLRDLALAGDVQAAKTYLDRVVGPVRHDRPDPTDLAETPLDDLIQLAFQDPEVWTAFERERQRRADGKDDGGVAPTAE